MICLQTPSKTASPTLQNGVVRIEIDILLTPPSPPQRPPIPPIPDRFSSSFPSYPSSRSPIYTRQIQPQTPFVSLQSPSLYIPDRFSPCIPRVPPVVPQYNRQTQPQYP